MVTRVIDVIRGARRPLRAALLLFGAMLISGVLAGTASADGVPLKAGDVLATLGNGTIGHFSPDGTLLDTLDTTSGSSELTGMCFDQSGNLYTTNFEANSMSKFDKNGNLVAASFGSGFNQHPESCVVSQAQHVFVGQADGSAQILEFDTSGTPINSYSPDTSSDRGTDWIDLAKDQHTIHYTGEGNVVQTFDVSTNTQGPDFATGLPEPCYAHRILPDGGEVVACASEVVRLDSSGNITKTYPVDPNNNLFALSINPDGKSFWTADFDGTVWNVDIATGNIIHTWNAHPVVDTAGLVVVGEQTVYGDQPITAQNTTVNATEGKAFSGKVATFNDPDTNATASEYSASINWGDGSTTTGTITGSGGNFTVNGTHTYAEEGSFTVTVTITDVDNASNTATATSTAKVADAALHGKAVNSGGSSKSFSGTVATFTDDDPAGTTSDYSASINWGDGKSSNGKISSSGGKFVVKGSHTYGHGGTFTLKITIKDKGGASTTVTSTITIGTTVVHGKARLTGVPSACVLRPVTLGVKGRKISSVKFSLDGSQLTTKTVKRGKSYSARTSVSPGGHALSVRVGFKKSSHTKAKTFHLTITGCPAVAPKFTG